MEAALSSEALEAFKRNGAKLTLIKDAIISSETSILTRAARCNIPEDGIFLIKQNVAS
jgi:hypothetical protein